LGITVGQSMVGVQRLLFLHGVLVGHVGRVHTAVDGIDELESGTSVLGVHATIEQIKISASKIPRRCFMVLPLILRM
jgi:hypothetical protein